MASSIALSFADGTKIAYIVRYKASHAANAVDSGHSDCVLPSGAPVGYFGSGAIGATGLVFGYSLFQSRRPEYVNLSDAKAKPCKSTMLVMEAGKAGADAFRKEWLAMRAKTDGFTILGNNCSTHASRACFAAGVIKTAEVSGVDTPTNLYDQIVKANLVAWRSYSGYLAFEPIQCGGDDLMLSYRVTVDPTEVPTDGGPRKP